jgi:hypothetical protein
MNHHRLALIISVAITIFSVVLISRAGFIRAEIELVESRIHELCDRTEISLQKSNDATTTALYIFGDIHREAAAKHLAQAQILSDQVQTLQNKPFISATFTRIAWILFTISLSCTAFLLLPANKKMAYSG